MDMIMLGLCGTLLEMKVVDGFSTYLGLPLSGGGNKMTILQWLDNKVQGSIQEWSASFLSRSGKEALIKACMQAYPIYAMTCFRFPKTLCDTLSAKALRFWWASGNNAKGIHWVHRNILLRDKYQGGLGFRCFDTLNTALLMKQIWRICKGPELLLSKVLKAKYFRGKGVLEANYIPSGFYAWKSLCSVLDIFKNGIACGNSGLEDIVWKSSASGAYSLKEGYSFAYQWKLSKSCNQGESSNRKQTQNRWKRLWRIKVPDRVKTHAWRLFHHALL